MQQIFSLRTLAFSLAFVIWALLAACGVWWFLLAQSGSGFDGAFVASSQSLKPDGSAILRALGVGAEEKVDAAPVVFAPSRFSVKGVVTVANRGAALISTDGGSAKIVKLGDEVQGSNGWVLTAVSPLEIRLEKDGASSTVAVPKPEVLLSAVGH